MKLDNAITSCVDECFKNVHHMRPHSLHGASIIGKNGRVIVSGHNHIRNKCSCRNMRNIDANVHCSFHAEIDTIHRFFGKTIRGKKGRHCLQEVST